MTRSTERSAKPEKAHVTTDPRMSAFYEWFMTCDRRDRARELVVLARWGFEDRNRRAANQCEIRQFPLPALAATTRAHAPETPGLRDEPAGFDDLVNPAMH